MTLGYCTNDTSPSIYYLLQDQDLDIGYLKLFLSTKYIDLSHVEQKSPFQGADEAERTRSTTDGDMRHLKERGEKGRMKSSGWDEITYVIVQRESASVGGIRPYVIGATEDTVRRTGFKDDSHGVGCRCSDYTPTRGDEGKCASCGESKERSARVDVERPCADSQRVRGWTWSCQSRGCIIL